MKNDEAHLLDILESAKSIRAYLAGLTVATFKTNEEKQDAVNRRFEIIGEAAQRLSEQTRATFPDIPWRLTTAMRNVLIHDYDDVDLDVVWRTAQNDLPLLIASLEAHFATQ
jgi:uncharacterized protein with HEPN domain